MTWKLTAGASGSQESYQGLQFYPSALTIDAGDTVTWTFPSGEPHTVTFLGNRASLPPPTDPSVPAPAGGNTYDGITYTSSGFVLLGKTYSLTFPTPGTYKFYCLIHGWMSGTITVQPARAAYPQAQSQYDAVGQTAITNDLSQSAASVSLFPYAAGGPHLAAGISPKSAPPPATSTVVRFLDGPNVTSNTVTVSVGTTVTWTNLSNNFPHTVTFGAVGQPFPTLSPFGPPSGGSTYDGSMLTNSGVIPPAQSYSLTFVKAGTFPYHCLFHDDTENMLGTVIVQ
ncbi:MAG: plastocyanin/azurin family copper-binding protein [Candidatus Eremiobacteraeota bacterium]|nr:plastocyanin/azurin family copper-binding protein [Candidatus Eremiobacteraeota bacterium]